MKLLTNFDLYELSHAIGWTLIHSIWQATIVGGIIWLLFRFISKDNARVRYALSGLALVLICIASAITFYRYLPSNTSFTPSDVSAQLKSNGILHIEETFFAKLWSQIQIHLEITFPYLVKIWMIGILFLSINLILKYIHTQKLKKHLTYPLRSDYKTIADRLVLKYNLKQNILFKESGLLDIPSVIGYFKPIVLLPVSMLSGIPENQLEIIIAHELAHIRRHDYLLQFIQGIIELIFFYHPVVWWLSSVVNAEREHICDDLAVKVCGESLTLIKALNNMEAIRKKQYELVLGFSGKNGKILNRIKRILRPKASTNPRRERFMLSGVFTLLFAGLFLISNFAISGNTDSQKAFYSKINILEKTINQPEKSIQNEALPIDLVNENSKNDQEKKKQKKENKTKVVATASEIEEVTEVEELEMPPMPPLPPAVNMPTNSFNFPEFNFPKDSVKSDKWVKMKADKIIKEQLEEMKSAEKEMKDMKIDLDVDQMRKELQKGLKDLNFNSAEFQNEMKEQQIEIEKQLKELTDGNFTREQKLQKRELENHLKEIEENTELSKKEREQLKSELQETVERMNSKEFQDQLKKQLEDAKESLEHHKAEFESGEFENQLKEQRENIQQELEKIESPEFQEKINQQIKESKTRIQEQIKRVNSEEYRKELEKYIKKNPKRSFNQDSITPSRWVKTGHIIPTLGNLSNQGYHGITQFRSLSYEAPNRQPLIILDGKKITRAQMEQMSPDKFASISVLKDASASKLYGEEAKNGVILITSKSQNSDKKEEYHSDKIDEVVVLGGGSMKNPDILTVGYGTNWKEGHPLYVVNGKILSDQNIKQLDKNDIENINIIKGEAATEKYGKKGENGVIEITSKANSKPRVKMRMGNTKNPLYILDGNKVPAEVVTRIHPDDIERMNVLKGKEAIKKYGESAQNGAVEINSKGLKFKDPIKIDNAIYIVDGKITSTKKADKINPDDIESINVLKGKHAIEKYGEKAKNGVIEISTKPQNSKNKPVLKIKGASINNPLYIVDGKKMSAKKVNKINPDNIERVDVLKVDKAIEMYGEEAKNGVVIITSKTKN